MMIRDRAWRRHMEERAILRRLSDRCRLDRWWWNGFKDTNGISHTKTYITTYIGTKDHFLAKTLSTTKYDSRYKTKYSPNNGGSYSRDEKAKGISTGLREKDKTEFLKILKENGLK